VSHYGKHPSLKRETEPVDTATWHWFICNGPHGELFQWHTNCIGESDVVYLRKFIDQKAEANPEFINYARVIALEALSNSDPVIVCKGIQVLTILGSDNDLFNMKNLLESDNESVVKNAKSCLFERRIKIKT
tara:strand:+ start:48 stop:443 length:396 start_codon:yes stop_codon:yes gene_type:complete